MAKVLCWEELSNGRYCKNYRLTDKNKCRNHFIPECVSMESVIIFVIMSYFTFLCILYCGNNSEMIDNYIYSWQSFIIEHVKEPIRLEMLELYKNYPVYMNNMQMYFSKIVNSKY